MWPLSDPNSTERDQRSFSSSWIYVDASKGVGDREHLRVFANEAAAEAWFKEHEPEGVAFEYELIE
jgi:hypothetical protein